MDYHADTFRITSSQAPGRPPTRAWRPSPPWPSSIPPSAATASAVFHAVREGGPAAAIARAVRYLDAYHEQDRLQKVQTVIRCTACQ